MKSYLFAYSQLCPDWQAQGVLDSTQAVANWIQPFPNAAVIQSNLDTKDLAAVLRNQLGQVWFVVSEVDSASIDGWLPGDAWQFVNTPGTPVPAFPTNRVPVPMVPKGGGPIGRARRAAADHRSS